MAADKVESLSEDPDVEYISPDRIVRPSMDYAMAAIQLTSTIRSQWTGTGIGVAVIDSGIDPHVDFLRGFTSGVVYQESFLPNATKDLKDAYGHGTHVAGIIAGTGKMAQIAGSTRSLAGVAPKVNLISLKVLDSTGAGTDSIVIAAIERTIALKSQYNIRVANLSLGRPVFQSYKTDPLCIAVEKLWTAGIVVIVAAGNDGRDNSRGTNGYGTINSPANHPLVITVGASRSMFTAGRSDDQMTSYSSKGPTAIDHIVKPDLVAPGNQIVSTVYTYDSTMAKSYPQNLIPLSYYINTADISAKVAASSSGFYYRMSGTSMSAPAVAGAVALLLQKDPKLTPDQVKARLMKTAAKILPGSSIAVDPITRCPGRPRRHLHVHRAGRFPHGNSQKRWPYLPVLRQQQIVGQERPLGRKRTVGRKDRPGL